MRRLRFSLVPLLCLTSLACEPGETGEPCWDDSECASSSCNGGSCDGGLLALFLDLFDASDAPSDDALACQGLDELACMTTEGCVANRSCFADLECFTAGRTDCSGGCDSFVSCEPR